MRKKRRNGFWRTPRNASGKYGEKTGESDNGLLMGFHRVFHGGVSEFQRILMDLHSGANGF